jgi:hypothetical protein
MKKKADAVAVVQSLLCKAQTQQNVASVGDYITGTMKFGIYHENLTNKKNKANLGGGGHTVFANNQFLFMLYQ